MQKVQSDLIRKHQHKISYFWKLVIVTILVGMSAIILFVLLGGPQTIAQKNVKFSPLFTYYDKQFQLNGLSSINLDQQLFTKIKNTQNSKKSLTKKNSRIVNIVHKNPTKSYDFDNWLFLGNYISFLLKKDYKIIQKKIMTQQFAESYQHFKYQSETNELQNQSKTTLHPLAPELKDINLLKFSESFQNVLNKQFFVIDQFREKEFAHKIKKNVDFFIGKFQSFFSNKQEFIKKVFNKKNNVWIIWILNLNAKEQNNAYNFLRKLQRDNKNDKFVIMSFVQILPNQYEIINYQSIERSHFTKLIKKQLNISNSHAKFISKQYEYSLLQLSKDVKNEESLTFQGLMERKLSFCDIRKIPYWVLDKIMHLCKGQRIKTLKIQQEQEKIHFYRLGLYKILTQVFWKDKKAKNNYQLQTGTFCKQIPVFHQDYFSLVQTSQKNIFINLFKKIKTIFSSKKQKV